MSYPQPQYQVSPVFPKSFVATWLLSLFLGPLGIDRFYLGKIGTGVLKLVTVGGCGLWSLVDLVVVLVGGQRDSSGLPLDGYQRHKATAWIVTVVVLVGGVALSLGTGALEAAA